MEKNLIDILQQKEATAQAYIETANRYNIPLETFGGKIPIHQIGNLPKHEQFKKIREQIAMFLSNNLETRGKNASEANYNNSTVTLKWEELYDRKPDKKLRLAIGLEILKDIVLERAEEDNIPKHETNGILPETDYKNMVLAESYSLLKEQRIADAIYKEWVASMMKSITKGPYSRVLEDELHKETPQSVSSKQYFVDKTAEILKKTKQWHMHNIVTLAKRIEDIRQKHPDFDPNSPKWQKILIERVQKEGIEFKIKDGYEDKDAPEPKLEKEPNLLIVGEKHGANNNSMFLYNILKDSKEHGFKNLTIEEPKSTGWSFYIEFAQSIKKTINHDPKAIETKAIEFCTGKGIPEKSLAQRLTLIHMARVLDYQIEFVDIKESEKKELSKKRKEENEKSIIDSPPTDINDPITALGGCEIFSKSIKNIYKDCRYRSQEMAKLISESMLKGKTIHVGGLLHSLDIQEEIKLLKGKIPSAITLDTKRGINALTQALGRYPKEDPKRGIIIMDTSLKYDKAQLEKLLSNDLANPVQKPKKIKKLETEIILN